jgi:argininosuccinate lyase
MLTILKGQPSGYNRDLQEDKIHLFAAADTVRASLDMATGIVSHTQFKAGKISAGLEAGFLDATALAEYLVRKGVPFRKAHGIVGALVTACEKKGQALSELSLEAFKEASPSIDSDVFECLGAANVALNYASAGAAGPQQVKQQITYWKKHLAQR